MSSEESGRSESWTHEYALGKRVSGTMINYVVVCPRKLWLFSRGLSREQDSELVTLGALLHSTSFPRRKKEVLILGRFTIDHTSRGQRVIVHEVKKTKNYSNAARAQLLFYLYEMERLGVPCTGELHFRSESRKEHVVLDDEGRKEVERLIEQVRSVVLSETPPAPQAGAPCRACSYRDYCWV
ncbi:MAG: CRISPR-associated protein Cas4 [Candidatus Thorarchaeota archaeon]